MFKNLGRCPLLCASLMTIGWILPAVAGTVEGFTEPVRDIDVSAPGEPSMIVAFNVQEGQTVKKGELLVELDTRVLRASLALGQGRSQMNGRVQAAQAEFDLRADRLKRLRELDADGHASQAELRKAATDLRVAQSNLVLAQEEKRLAALECDRIKTQIEQKLIRSPIDGVVVEVFREAGESTNAGDSLMMRIVQLDKLRVKFPVSVDQANQCTVGDDIELRIPAVASSAPATVEMVSPVLDAESGTVEVTCLIENEDGKFCSGMRCLMNVEGESSFESELDFSDPVELSQD